MTDLGDLTILLKDKHKTLSNLEWADVDLEEYQEYEETLPNQNLDAIPDLEEHWKHLSDNDVARLSPENREPSKPNTPFWSEREISNQLSDENKVQIVEDFLRKHLMAGTTAKEASFLLKTHFDKRTLSKAAGRIKSAFRERGLLGTVYVDSTLFPSCSQGEGQDFVDKHNKESKFVLAKDSCSGCVWNKEGKCSRFQKDLVFDVEYTEDLWDHYENKAKSLGKDLSQIKSSYSPKEKIRKASLAPLKGQAPKLDNKPVVRNLAASVSKEDAISGIKSADIQREIIENVYKSNKLERIALEMIKGNHGPQIKDALDTDPDLAPLKDHLYLMGRLYVNASYFDNEKQAQDILENKNVLVYGSFQNDKKATSETSFSLRSPEVINKIVNRYALTQYGPSNLETKKSVLKKMASRLCDFDEERLRRFAQNVYQNPLPQSVSDYEVHGNNYVDASRETHFDTESFSSPFHNQVTKSAEKRTNDLSGPLKKGNQKALREVSRRMLKGDHGPAVQSLIKTNPDLKPLENHLHLLGRLYTASFPFTGNADREYFHKRNSHLQKLPEMHNVQDFFGKKETHISILKRAALLKGIHPQDEKEKIESFVESKLSSLTGKSPTYVRKVAREVFAKNLPDSIREYQDTHYATAQFKESQMEVRPEDLESFKTKINSKKRGKVSRDFKYFLKKEGGKKVLEVVTKRLGLQTLKDVWLQKSKTSSTVYDHTRRQNAEKLVFSEVVNPDFEPIGSDTVLMPSFFETKIGRWMRDRMIKGSSGKKLSLEIEQSFTKDYIIENAPIILAMREEEGLFGTAYSSADSFADCAVGKRALKSSVTQIVRGDKCSGCVYNKKSGCLLYSKDLVDQPSYTSDTLKKALSRKVSSGTLDRRDVEDILNSTASFEDKVRLANRVSPTTKTRKGTQSVKGFYGDSLSDAKAEQKLGSMLKKARQLLLDGHSEPEVREVLAANFDSKVMKLGSVYLDKIVERTQTHMSDFVNLASLEAGTGLDQMEDLELTTSHVQGVLDNIDFNGESKDNTPLDNISFNGFTTE